MEPNLPRDESNSASPQNSSRQWERRDQSQREGPSQVRGLFGEGAFAEESRRIIEAFREVDAARSSLVKEELTYGQFLQAVIADPRHMIRNTFQYTADAMESFGFELKNILGKEVRDFRVRQWPWESAMVEEKKKLEGQELALDQFYQQMQLFGRREYANRMFIFSGPPGSGKTRLNETIDAMLERYSEDNPKGALYRLIWVFPPPEGSARFGFPIPRSSSVELDREEDAEGARLVYRPPGNTDPLFLLARSLDGSGPREQILARLERTGRLPGNINRDYLLRGELDTFSEELWHALRSHYRAERVRDVGDGAHEQSSVIEKILKRHVRVERYSLSRRQGRGICSLWASPNRNADLEPFYNSYAPPPVEIQTSERDLYRPASSMIAANRGHLHFSDLFRPDERDRGATDTSHLNHLLNEIENGEHQIMSLRQAAHVKTEKVNVVLRADANDELVAVKAQGQGFDSLARRLVFIPVPHITRFLSEASAHRDFLGTVVGPQRCICPHVVETFSLFATATRLLKPDPAHYTALHERLPRAVGSMSVVEKALLLQEPRNNVRIELNMIKSDEQQRWSQEELGLLRTFLPKIADEYSAPTEASHSSFYDGGIGLSTASAQDFLRRIAVFKPHEPISLLEVIKVLRQHAGRFAYYEKIQEAKDQYVQTLLQQRKQDAQRQGKTINNSEAQVILRELAEIVEQRYPISAPELIIDEVEKYAQRCVQEDFYFALGLASEQQSALSIRRYLEHARVSIGQPPLEVAPFYRVSGQEVAANEKLLCDFEDRIVQNEDLSSVAKRLEYRRRLFEQIGNWQAEHPHENVLHNYEVIFGELVQGIRVAQKETLERPLAEFRARTDEYAADPSKIEKDTFGSLEEREKVREWKRAIRALEEKLGYPREEGWLTIRKNLEWALRR